jgi:RNA polymerase sigma-70 factor (ECF subfamily)
MIGRREITLEERPAELEAQLADFFAEHYDRLIRLAGLVCHSPSSAEDAVQAAMEKAWRRRGSLRDASRLRPWLDQIIVRESIRQNRRPWWARLGRPANEEWAQPADRHGGVDPDWVALSVAFRQLPSDQRAVLALHLYAGHTVEQTAQIMGAGLETTRSRLRLARSRLRRELVEDQR